MHASNTHKMQGTIDSQCANCRRQGDTLLTRVFDRCLLRGKQSRVYYCIGKLGKNCKRVRLCGLCDHYLLEKSNDPCDYWPAMVFKFLSHVNSAGVAEVSFQEKWKVVPETWRHWWSFEFRDIMVDSIDSVFVDLTKELEETEKAITRLLWRQLAETMDKHFAYPEVGLRHYVSTFLSARCVNISVWFCRFDVHGDVQSFYTARTNYICKTIFGFTQTTK